MILAIATVRTDSVHASARNRRPTMPAVEKSIDVKCDPKHFYGIITDFERYHEFVPSLKKATVLEKKGEVYRVEQRIELMKKSIAFVLRLEGKPGKSLSWTLEKGDLLKANDGAWTIEKKGKDQITASYALDLEVGMLVPKAIVNTLASADLPRMLEAFKTRAEASWGKR